LRLTLTGEAKYHVDRRVRFKGLSLKFQAGS